VVTELTRGFFRGTSAFALRGKEGEELLSSALAGPRLPYYRTSATKAGSLLFRLIQNHPYIDGNKRLALTAALAFLFVNRRIVLASAADLEALAVGVASGVYSQQDAASFFRARSLSLAWSTATTIRWYRSLGISDRIAVATGLPRMLRRFEQVRDFAIAIQAVPAEEAP
jgi:death on curing protein